MILKRRKPPLLLWKAFSTHGMNMSGLIAYPVKLHHVHARADFSLMCTCIIGDGLIVPYLLQEILTGVQVLPCLL